MNLKSWGNYPIIKNTVFNFETKNQLSTIINNHHHLIPYGNGRSYGDSALNENIINVKPYGLFLDFDQTKGLLHVQAGVLLAEILSALTPRGWFLKITPGTKFITVGGAIASDVHGKNHHVQGCFSECVEMLKLMLASGEIVVCSKQENIELFQATCGGMGLTGVILEAKISLKPIKSKYIQQTTLKTRNLKETFDAFDHHKQSPYSVAWIDCLAQGEQLGKSLLMVGDFSDDGNLDYQPNQKFNIPTYLPSFTLNHFAVKAFNGLYYEKVRTTVSNQMVDIENFFYPLDAIGHWNKMYGKKGFTQYQFILPLQASYSGLQEILSAIAASGKGSFLAVLKLYGPANDNYLSFPMEGYSLALDFKIEPGLFELLDELDKIVLKHSGRIYLAKDTRVKKDIFEQGYPHVNKFRSLRAKYNLQEKFNSLQSQRLGI